MQPDNLPKHRTRRVKYSSVFRDVIKAHDKNKPNDKDKLSKIEYVKYEIYINYI